MAVFGILHFLVPGTGPSTTLAALQAASTVVQFIIVYVLTENLALPIGLYFSMDFINSALFSTSDSGVPTLVRVNQGLTAEPSVVALIILSTALLTLRVAAWVRLTCGVIPVGGCFARTGSKPKPTKSQKIDK